MSETLCKQHRHLAAVAKCDTGDTFCLHCPEYWSEGPLRPTKSLPIDPKQLQDRVQALDAGKQWLKNNFLLLDNCEKEVVGAVEESIAELVQVKKKALDSLAHLRARLQQEITAAVEEAEDALFDPSKPLWTPIATAILEKRVEDLQLFTCAVNHQKAERPNS